MTKLFQAFLTGIFFTFILDFFFFLGIQENYIHHYNVDVYYNILFADHQNIAIFLFFTLIIGYSILYLPTLFSLSFVSLLFVIVLSTLLPSIGLRVGSWLLMEKNVTLYTKKYSYKGDIYYKGRKNVTFYDYDLKKVIILPKNEIEGEY